MGRTRMPETPFGWAMLVLAVVAALLFVAWLKDVERRNALLTAETAGCHNPRVVDTTSFSAAMRGCWGKHATVYDIEGEGSDELPMKVAVCCTNWGCDEL